MQSSSFFFPDTYFIKVSPFAGRFPQGRATSRTITLSGYSSGIRQFPTYALAIWTPMIACDRFAPKWLVVAWMMLG